jgi:hypothetical protein
MANFIGDRERINYLEKRFDRLNKEVAQLRVLLNICPKCGRESKFFARRNTSVMEQGRCSFLLCSWRKEK